MNIKNGMILAGKYRIEKPISEDGGMAKVYLGGLAENTKFKVAVKFARSESAGAMPEDMLLDREADLLSKWNWRHPGVVRVYPIPLEGRSPAYSLNAIEMADKPRYMVMEYLSGGSLADNAQKIKNYPLGWKLETFYQIMTAVSHLHQLKFGHRDLKPENIVFREPISPNSYPIPVLVDFALASNGHDQFTVVEASHTLEYASPERLLKTMGYDELPPYPLEADIWSLGVILYELITGERLIRGSENKVRTTIIKGAFSVDIYGSQIDSHPATAEMVAKLIRKMLEPDPTKRPNAKILLLALEELFPPPRLAIS